MAEKTEEDKLDTIFKMQSALNEYIISKRGLPAYSKEEWLQKQVLAMLSEISELLNEVNFKWWKNPKPLDEKAIANELVDILHFMVSMFLHAGMTADDVLKVYLEKNKENYKRQQGLSEKEGYKIKE